MNTIRKQSVMKRVAAGLLSLVVALFLFPTDVLQPVYAADITYTEWNTDLTFSEDTTVDGRVKVSGTRTVTIGDGATVTVSQGITVPAGSKLIINGSGTLNTELANRAEYGGWAGIGGDPNYPNAGTIVINGGTIVSRGGPLAAGIGGGCGDTAGRPERIEIHGGNVRSSSGFLNSLYGAGAGIGGSSGGGSGTIVITGGTVYAEGGAKYLAAGIGCGDMSRDYNISISGGNITAVGATSLGESGCAGIGAGQVDTSSRGHQYNGGVYSGNGVIQITGGAIRCEGTLGDVSELYTGDSSLRLSWTDKDKDSLYAAKYFFKNMIMASDYVDDDRVVHLHSNNSWTREQMKTIQDKTIRPAKMRLNFYLNETDPYYYMGDDVYTIEILYGKNFFGPMDPSWEYGSFLGWYQSWHEYDANTATDKLDFDSIVTQDMDLYAGWNRPKYNITYNAGRGMGNDVVYEVYSGDSHTVLDNEELKNGGFIPVYAEEFKTWKDQDDVVREPGFEFVATKNWTFTGQYGPISYTIRFVDDDGTLIKEVKHDMGTQPYNIDKPADPTKEKTAQYTYAFTGWSPALEVVSKNQTYTATYSKTVNSYKVTWKDYDGWDLDDAPQVLEYGTKPTHTEPTMGSDSQYTYTFAGWADGPYKDSGIPTADLPIVSEDVTYYAAFAKTLRQYKVTFVDEDGTVLKEATTYDYGTAATDIVQPTEPQKGDEEHYTYTFAGWSPALSEVTKDVTYKATYTKTGNPHTVTFLDQDGQTVLKAAQTVAYGTAIDQVDTPEDPTKAADDHYTYTFAGWAEEANQESGTLTADLPDVTGDVTYYAAYSKALNQYAVTFVDEDGETVIQEARSYDYGTPVSGIDVPSDPTKGADAQYTYTFAGWNPALEAVTKNVTYRASYSSTLRNYTVTFEDGQGNVLKSESVTYGSGATAPEDPTRKYYTFGGWDVDFSNITGDLTVTAQWTRNKATVSFEANGAGGSMASVELDEGTEYTLPASGFTYAEHQLTGWKVGDTVYAVGAPLLVEGDTVCVAQWRPNGYNLYVGGINVNADNKNDVLEDGTVSYDSENGILTLTNATIEVGRRNTEDDHNEYGIRFNIANKPLTIVLKGENTFVNEETADDTKEVYGIYVAQAPTLTMEGDGSLAIQMKADQAQVEKTTGMEVRRVTTLDGVSVSIDIPGDQKTLGLYLMYSNQVKLTNGAALTIQTGSHAETASFFNDRLNTQDLSMEEGCTFQAISENVALSEKQNSNVGDITLTEDTKALGLLVNTQASETGARVWDGSTALKTYRYVSIPYTVDKTALEEAVEAAQAVQEGIETSADGKDLTDGTRYTTPQEKQTLTDALEAAQSVLEDPTAPQGEINEALETLQEATAAYEEAIKTASVDKSGLEASMEAAKKASDGITTSADGKDLTDGTKFTTPKDKQNLDTAIGDAQKVLENPAATQNEVDAATKALQDAQAAYEKAIQTAVVDKKALEESTDTTTDPSAIKESQDGSDVDAKDQWMTPADKATYEQAIQKAKEVLADDNATQSQVDTALAELKKAASKAKNGSKNAKPDAPIRYDNTLGNGNVWTKGSGEVSTFTFKRSVDDKETYSRFTGIEVDGQAVASSDYTKKEGSVIISLQPAYLETLAVGEHTLKVNFNDGNASAKFTVVGKTTPTPTPSNVPNTGDTTTLGGWLLIFGASLTGIGWIRRKKKNNS